MIPKITNGSFARGALEYDHGRGRADEHKNPHKIAGNVPGRDWRDRARLMDRHASAAKPDLKRYLHRTALRLAPEDRQLTDQEWKRVAETYVQDMGFKNCPWEATRHDADHIHITVVRVQWDGREAKNSNDRYRAQPICRKLERDHGLANASERYNRDRPQVSGGEREKAERLSQRAGKEVKPEREQLRDLLLESERASGGDRLKYGDELTKRGVVFEANVSESTGRVSGYRYGLTGHEAPPKGERSGEPEQVWFKGSQLGKEFSWNRTQERLDQQREQSVPPRQQGMTREEAKRIAEEQTTRRRSGVERPDQQVRHHDQDRAAADSMTREQAREIALQQMEQRRQQQAERDTAQPDRSTPDRSGRDKTRGDSEVERTQRDQGRRRQIRPDNQRDERDRDEGMER